MLKNIKLNRKHNPNFLVQFFSTHLLKKVKSLNLNQFVKFPSLMFYIEILIAVPYFSDK
jgi:hypothetical protein